MLTELSDATTASPAITSLGWDMTYATTFAQLNRVMAASGTLPQTFAGTSANAAAVSGAWASWTVVSGGPSNRLYLSCVVAHGQLTTAARQSDISGSVWTVQLGLTLAKGGTTPGGGTRWQLATSATGPEAPILTGHANVQVSGSDLYVLEQLMAEAIVPQVLALDLSGIAITTGDTTSASDQPWLVPTSAEFACESLPPGDARGGIIGLLAMTEGRSAAGKQVVIDARVLDGAPDGASAAWFLGPTLMTSQLLAPAIQGLVQGSQAANFSVDGTGTTVYNNSDMTWGAFSYDESDGTTVTVTPRIPKGNIQLSLNGSLVHLSMSNINFPYPGWAGPGEITVAFNAEQFIGFQFIQRADGGLVMVPDTQTFGSSSNITIIPDQTVLEFQIALNAVTQVLMAFVGGAIESVGEAAGAAMQEGAEGTYNAEFDLIEMEELGNSVNPNVEQTEEDAATQAGDALANEGKAGYVQRFKNAVIANRWKILSKVVQKMVTIPVGKVSDIALWAAEKDYDKLPTLQPFVSNAVTAVHWANGATFTPVGGSVQGGMLIWGTLTE
ncbi:TULIP family P47-like protein [Rudanella paleaurantiibacter]|uniref:TULIP family P47-like protein n=1 Tax=Rudanella paleaurantiibacter TaxID=2614655 RepID=A0A7J5U3U2_9BACT|nr:TULIP family P47-like protein [Rudanella paleaurantiibacter]KAB7732512.1 TULIP family P47-like protein [Rudanella paleaurantiibacter]